MTEDSAEMTEDSSFLIKFSKQTSAFLSLPKLITFLLACDERYRITSYNVCYTKLLRTKSILISRGFFIASCTALFVISLKTTL